MHLSGLVLVEDYPSELSQTMMFVHIRNKYYQKCGISITVLNFRAKKDYVYENINVITSETYNKNSKSYDLLLCHASNIKHHYRFIKKYQNKFTKIVFFYHGHEILKLGETYPSDYIWQNASKLKSFLRNYYDSFKLFLWRKELRKILPKSHLIFVSRWLYDRFLYYVHLNPKMLDNNVSIINNSVGEIFEKESYDINTPKLYDFITIRGGGLDKRKYGIDIVCRLAEKNSHMKFLIIGKGKYFEKNPKPNNVEFVNKSLTHNEMMNYLNSSKCALMPTRQDTQGVMTCEMATYGIPAITSDIEVCREILNGFSNVELIDNDKDEKLDKVMNRLLKKLPYNKNEKYFAKNTISKEVELFKQLLIKGN